MTKRMRKILLISIVFVIAILSFFIPSFASSKKKASGISNMSYQLNHKSNFFTQVENKKTIKIEDKTEYLESNGYVLEAQNQYLALYFKQQNCAIAIKDKVSGYTWFSSYQNPLNYQFTSLVSSKNDSGVVIEYYLVDTKGVINSTELCYTAKTNNKQNGSCKVSKVTNGIDIAVDFDAYGISFKIEVRLDGKNLTVNVPYESIKEETVGKLTKKDYKLKSISLFPYLGSENYNINGYSFIPDGSGALIRYTDEASSTAYVKKLYGADYSFSSYSNKTYIKDNGVLSLPIYGVNHGYNQAAFLCSVDEGYGSVELHSYPYMFNNIPINTTFFKYYTRDTFNVVLSSETMNLLLEDVYDSDFKITYSFLNGENANYVGMANTYRDKLNLKKESANDNIPLHLSILGLDYKPGLFGHNYVVMTKYDDALNIVKDLENENISSFALTYIGWNKGGYFNKGSTNAKTTLKLGSKKKLIELNDYLSANNSYIDYSINPLISQTFGFGNKTVKRIGLSPFDVTLKSSIEQTGYYVNPNELSRIINSKQSKYDNLHIDCLKIDNLNVAYSYRYDGLPIYRTKMIDQLKESLSEVDLGVAISKPNDYLLDKTVRYYDAFYEANKFTYETDSIPFMSILLSGYIDQYMPDINFVSDYNLAVLRMIEYNLYPSFIITEEEAFNLRYTNFEYLNSTQYDLWKDLIVDMYSKTNDALKHVSGASILNHEYVLPGVAKVTYDNNVQIYVNYNNSPSTVDGEEIPGYGYIVIGG